MLVVNAGCVVSCGCWLVVGDRGYRSWVRVVGAGRGWMLVMSAGRGY